MLEVVTDTEAEANSSSEEWNGQLNVFKVRAPSLRDDVWPLMAATSC